MVLPRIGHWSLVKLLSFGCQYIISLHEASAPEGGEVIFLHLGKGFAGDGIARDEDDVHGLRKIMLVQPETFAQEAAGAGTFHGATDLLAGDHTEPGVRPGGKLLPVGDEAALGQPFASLSHPGKVATLGQSRGTAQAETRAQTFGVWRP